MQTRKRIFLLVGSLLIILFCSFLASNARELQAWFRLPSKNIQIEDRNSKLILLPEDFSGDFRWYSILITESNNISSVENPIAEGSSSTLAGFYDGEQIAILFQIKRSADEQTLQQLYETSISFPINGELSTLQVKKKFDVQKSSCFYWVDNSSQCSVAVVFKDKFMMAEVKVEPGTSKSVLENVTNVLLDILERKFKLE